MIKSKDQVSNFRQYLVKHLIPYWVYFELTYRCNFKCIHCYAVDDKAKKELSKDEVYSILNGLAANNGFNIIFTGGEPFIRKDWFEIANFARRKGFSISFFTNGALIDAVKARQLKELGTRAVYINLLATDKKIYQVITQQKGALDSAMRGIDCLLQEKVPVILRTTVLRQNFKEIPKLERWAKQKNLPFYCNIALLNRIDGSKIPSRCRLNLGQQRKFAKHPFPSYPYKIPKKYILQQRNRCPGGVFMATISPYGDLYPCLSLRPRGYNLRKSTFTHLWQTAKAIKNLRLSKAADLEACAIDGFFSKYCFDCQGNKST